MILILIIFVLCFGGLGLYLLVDIIRYREFDREVFKCAIGPVTGFFFGLMLVVFLFAPMIGLSVEPKHLNNSVEFTYAKGTSDGAVFFNENNEIVLSTSLSEGDLVKLSYDFERQIYVNDSNLLVNEYAHSIKTQVMWLLPNRVEYKIK